MDSHSPTHKGQKPAHQSHTQDPTHAHRPPPSTSDLISSAKLVAGAAKSALRHDTDSIDRAKVSGAAGDLLSAASHYGKLEEKSFGKYVEKAETYLHQYGATHSSTHSTVATEAHSSPGHSSAHSTVTTETHSSSTHSGEKPHSGGGIGDYMKMAEGFVSSSHSGGGGHSEGGIGDYVKMAEGFLKKH